MKQIGDGVKPWFACHSVTNRHSNQLAHSSLQPACFENTSISFGNGRVVVNPLYENGRPLIDAFVSHENKEAASALFALHKGSFSSFAKYLLPHVLPDLDAGSQTSCLGLFSSLEALLSSKVSHLSFR